MSFTISTFAPSDSTQESELKTLISLVRHSFLFASSHPSRFVDDEPIEDGKAQWWGVR